MKEKFSLKQEHCARTIFVVCNVLFFCIIAFLIIMPLLKSISDSFDVQANSVGTFKIIPEKFTTYAYKSILHDKYLYLPFLISLFMSSIGPLVAMILTSFLAYGLIQEKLPFRKTLVYFCFFTMIFQGGLIPRFLAIKSYGMVDTLWAILLPQCINTYFLLLMMNFFRTIPKSFFDAAKIDGATTFGLFFRILIPLSKPALAAIGLFYMVLYWNMFFPYIIFITRNTHLYNFQVVLRNMVLFTGQEQDMYTSSMANIETIRNAALIITIIPVAMLYPFLQKYFIKGINLGGIKG